MSRTSLRTATAVAGLQVHADREKLTDDSSDLGFVTIELRDDAGTLVTDSDRLVSVTVGGAGTLQALGSARPDTTERFDATEHTSFDGRLLAVVRPIGAGTVTVEVAAEGMDPVAITLNVAAAGDGRASDAAIGQEIAAGQESASVV